MEKVYKHKKTGEIITYKDGIIKSGNCSIETGVEPSSEFWMELTYEILSFKSKFDEFYNPRLQKDGTFLDNPLMSQNGGGASLKWMLNEDEYYISSVKRLSDNEVFSIGDKINFRGLYGNSSEHKYDTIKGFEFKQDGSLGVRYHNGLVGIEKIQKYKEALFTTEDGVDIFEGDEVTWLYTDELKIAGTRKADKNMYTDLKYFSKKEKAEEHILMNKPLLSLNDLLSVWCSEKDFDAYKNSPMFQNFKNLAKTKL